MTILYKMGTFQSHSSLLETQSARLVRLVQRKILCQLQDTFETVSNDSSPSSTSLLVLFNNRSTSGIVLLISDKSSLPFAKVFLALSTSFKTVGSIDSVYSVINSSSLELTFIDKSLILLKIL